MHILSVASTNPDEYTRDLVQKMTKKELREKYLSLIRALKDLNNFYSRKATKLGEERARKHSDMIEQFAQEDHDLDKENTYSLASIIYSKEVEKKRQLVRELEKTNKTKQLERARDELDALECKERNEHMYEVNQQIVASKTALNAKHEAARQAFATKWDDQEDRLERDRRRDIDSTRRSLAIVKEYLKQRHIKTAEEEEEDYNEEYDSDEEVPSNTVLKQSSRSRNETNRNSPYKMTTPKSTADRSYSRSNQKQKTPAKPEFLEEEEDDEIYTTNRRGKSNDIPEVQDDSYDDDDIKWIPFIEEPCVPYKKQ